MQQIIPNILCNLTLGFSLDTSVRQSNQYGIGISIRTTHSYDVHPYEQEYTTYQWVYNQQTHQSEKVQVKKTRTKYRTRYAQYLSFNEDFNRIIKFGNFQISLDDFYTNWINVYNGYVKICNTHKYNNVSLLDVSSISKISLYKLPTDAWCNYCNQTGHNYRIHEAVSYPFDITIQKIQFLNLTDINGYGKLLDNYILPYYLVNSGYDKLHTNFQQYINQYLILDSTDDRVLQVKNIYENQNNSFRHSRNSNIYGHGFKCNGINIAISSHNPKVYLDRINSINNSQIKNIDDLDILNSIFISSLTISGDNRLTDDVYINNSDINSLLLSEYFNKINIDTNEIEQLQIKNIVVNNIAKVINNNINNLLYFYHSNCFITQITENSIGSNFSINTLNVGSYVDVINNEVEGNTDLKTISIGSNLSINTLNNKGSLNILNANIDKNTQITENSIGSNFSINSLSNKGYINIRKISIGSNFSINTLNVGSYVDVINNEVEGNTDLKTISIGSNLSINTLNNKGSLNILNANIDKNTQITENSIGSNFSINSLSNINCSVSNNLINGIYSTVDSDITQEFHFAYNINRSNIFIDNTRNKYFLFNGNDVSNNNLYITNCDINNKINIVSNANISYCYINNITVQNELNILENTIYELKLYHNNIPNISIVNLNVNKIHDLIIIDLNNNQTVDIQGINNIYMQKIYNSNSFNANDIIAITCNDLQFEQFLIKGQKFIINSTDDLIYLHDELHIPINDFFPNNIYNETLLENSFIYNMPVDIKYMESVNIGTLNIDKTYSLPIYNSTISLMNTYYVYGCNQQDNLIDFINNNITNLNLYLINHQSIYFKNNNIGNAIIESKNFEQLLYQQIKQLPQPIQFFNNVIDDLRLKVSCFRPKIYDNIINKLNLDYCNFIHLGMERNVIQDLTIQGLKYIDYIDLPLATIVDNLTSLKLYDNILLNKIIFYDDIFNIVDSKLITLDVRYCALNNLVITKQRFPNIKNLTLIGNYIPYLVNEKYYRNNIIFQDKMVGVQVRDEYQYRLLSDSIYQYKICDGTTIKYIDEKQLRKFLKRLGIVNNKKTKNNIQDIVVNTYNGDDIIYYCCTYSLPILNKINENQNQFIIDFQDIKLENLNLQYFNNIYDDNLNTNVLNIDLSNIVNLNINHSNASVINFFNINKKINSIDISNNKLEYFTNDSAVNTITNTSLYSFNISNNNVSGDINLNNNYLSNIDMRNNSTSVNNYKKFNFVNLNNNRIIDFTHDEPINHIDIKNQYYEETVTINGQSQLQGIYTLKSFDCNNVNQIDISQNYNLQKFNSKYGDLKNLNLNGFSKLKQIDVSYSKLRELELNYAPYLTYLNVNFCTNIYLNVDTRNLLTLYANNTNAEYFYLPNIRCAYCANNNINKIDVGLHNLHELDLHNNKIKSFDIDYNNVLNNDVFINLKDNEINTIKFENLNNKNIIDFDNTNILYIENGIINQYLSYNKCNNIDRLSIYNIDDDKLVFDNKNISSIQILQCNNLKQIDVINSEIVNIIFDCKNSHDFQLMCVNSKIEYLDIVNNNIRSIKLINNFLKNINIRKHLHNLKYLEIVENHNDFNVQEFLTKLYDKIDQQEYQNKGNIIITSNKIQPYLYAPIQIIEAFNQKNWNISIY